jgi:pyrroline-5-carboxylate reductase
MPEQHTTIGFIGAGNMASALIDGLIANGRDPAHLAASDTDGSRLETLRAKGILTSADNAEVVRQSTAVILAVKPQVMADVLTPLQEILTNHECLLVSIAAGIGMDSLLAWTHPKQAIVRCMPNTPALVQSSASALFANSNCSAHQKTCAEDLLNAVGIVCWLEQEADMDAVTALSGSGPAYFFLLMEAMQEAAVAQGLSIETAQLLCRQTALGAAKLAMQSDVDVGELRRRVTSPGGTTEAALRQFESDDFNAMVARALEKASNRSKELAVSSGNHESVKSG